MKLKELLVQQHTRTPAILLIVANKGCLQRNMKNKAYVSCLFIQIDIMIHTDDNESYTDHLIFVLSTKFLHLSSWPISIGPRARTWTK